MVNSESCMKNIVSTVKLIMNTIEEQIDENES